MVTTASRYRKVRWSVSSVIDTSPLISVLDWPDTVCTVDHTNFLVRVDPRGMDTVLTIDPEARFLERFHHLYGMNAVFARSGVSGGIEQLNTPQGYRQFYDYCAEHAQYETVSVQYGLEYGFLFEVDCHKDSPLVGWFLVLGVENG